jgi:hypothetical protein
MGLCLIWEPLQGRQHVVQLHFQLGVCIRLQHPDFTDLFAIALSWLTTVARHDSVHTITIVTPCTFTNRSLSAISPPSLSLNVGPPLPLPSVGTYAQ